MRYSRSYLFIPATDTEALERAREGPADAIVLDMEDALKPPAKPDGRRTARAALEERSRDSKPHVVRVNGLDTEWGVSDLEVLLSTERPPDALLLPDVRSESDVDVVDDLVREAGHEDETGIVPLVERPAAVFRAHEIARASPLVSALAFGMGDLRRHLGTLAQSDADVSLPRYLVSLAASAVDVPAIDTPYLQRDDPTGLRMDTREGRRMGYDAKLTFLSDQISEINELFTPSIEEVERSRHFIDAFESAPDEEGAIYVDGTFLDKPVVEAHRERVVRAAKHGVDPSG
jgi:citrate lyase beta subunit